MKIALFSDIYANLPALDAFFNDVDQKSPDAIYAWAILLVIQVQWEKYLLLYY